MRQHHDVLSRPAKLVELRNLKMARSPHAYVRGNTTKFYEWLATSSGTAVPQGPPVWICGDCHLGNLGPLADTDGRVHIQIRDLDQTVIGNPAHDLIRLGLSLASAVRGSDLPGVTTARIIEHLIAGYETALTDDKALARDREPELVKAILKQAIRRRWHHLAMERLDTNKPVLPRGDNFWPLSEAEEDGLSTLLKGLSLSTILGFGERRPEKIKIVDSAFWIKGCSSLGRLRFAVMLKVSDDELGATYRLVDVKEALKAAAPSAARAAIPSDNAVRVVTGAQALSPNLGGRMVAGTLVGASVVVRELAPQDLKLQIERLTRKESTALSRYLGAVVGRAHGRQMTDDVRLMWVKELAKARRGALDAPSWLWSSVVQLLSSHELAYLEHCRKFALAQAG
jgi:uncharacterized protein (DUF2252 family)